MPWRSRRTTVSPWPAARRCIAAVPVSLQLVCCSASAVNIGNIQSCWQLFVKASLH
jgi:hypothetical protein